VFNCPPYRVKSNSSRERSSQHGKQQPPYPAQFKEEAVLPTRTSGKPPAQIARDLGVSLESLRNWIKQAEMDTGAQDGLTTEEQGELRRLSA